MWLLNSSIGKKLIMSISGLFLVLFLLFHLSMNVAAVFSGEAYNMVCSLLGSNWYAVAATLVLAAGVVIHFVYAIILTLQNRKARGNDRYAINARPKGVEWASQNMFVLGLIVIPVSYTHLDVYKRHVYFTATAFPRCIPGFQRGIVFITLSLIHIFPPSFKYLLFTTSRM